MAKSTSCYLSTFTYLIRKCFNLDHEIETQATSVDITSMCICLFKVSRTLSSTLTGKDIKFQFGSLMEFLRNDICEVDFLEHSGVDKHLIVAAAVWQAVPRSSLPVLH